jgi:hypothetical protein
VSGKRGREASVSVSVYFGATLLRPKNCVPQRLSGFVSELARAKRFEPDLAFIESALRCLPCAVELFLELVE